MHDENLSTGPLVKTNIMKDFITFLIKFNPQENIESLLQRIKNFSELKYTDEDYIEYFNALKFHNIHYQTNNLTYKNMSVLFFNLFGDITKLMAPIEKLHKYETDEKQKELYKTIYSE